MGKALLGRILSSLISLFLVFAGQSLFAQETILLISKNVLKSDTAEINIARMDGWIFKAGHQPSWANENTDPTGWKKRKPEDLSLNDADKNGRVEGWFRIKIKTDSSLTAMPLGFRYSGWGAAEVYVDGKLIQSYGTAGTDEKSFHEYNPLNRSSVPIPSGPEKVHIIAIHFTDYIANVPYPKQIKSIGFVKTRQYTFTNALFSLTAPGFNASHTNKFYFHLVFKTAVAAIILVITILFWLVSYQNPREISLRLITVFSSLGVIFAMIKVLCHSQSISFSTFTVSQSILSFMAFTMLGLIPFVIAESLQQKVKWPLRLLYAIEILTGIISLFYYSYLITFPIIVLTFINVGILGYFIIKAWETIKGAQWAIIGAFGNVALWNSISLLFISSISVQYFLLMEAIIFLSLPFGYVIYISMRFREIIHEVKENATQLVLVSEEKKELAARQNEMLEQQVTERTAELHQSIQELKATQKQLIQSEKMASLGELTAGIAHEIQNPLNFVNNFSEVSTELVDEMNEEMKNGNLEDAQQIAQDLKQNLEKINHHGKRAGDIVKGMLQHSRSSSGQKEPTDINALCDEYLRLAYHGLRAKDKSFNASFETIFDHSIGIVSIQPQEIGRVVLNLINNAFYAVAEKKKNSMEAYEPKVTVITEKKNGNILISVKDNGTGIPQKAVDKIFQPFFTTKPTGQGTGLGLSLSYDIVKAHGGELKVETKEGKGAEFIIQLPIA